MARPIPPERFDQLVRTAAEVFIRNGYRRTQMADVAEALGIAKGTVYLYVESKEALFDVVARHVDDEKPIISLWFASGSALKNAGLFAFSFTLILAIRATDDRWGSST